MEKVNQHSIYTQCWECGERGVNIPENISCGNCNSGNTSRYYAEEDLEFGLEQRAKDRKLRIAADFLCKKLQESILENLKSDPLTPDPKRQEFIEETYKKLIEPHILYAESFDCDVSMEGNGQDKSVLKVSMRFKNPSPTLRGIIEESKQSKND